MLTLLQCFVPCGKWQKIQICRSQLTLVAAKKPGCFEKSKVPCCRWMPFHFAGVSRGHQVVLLSSLAHGRPSPPHTGTPNSIMRRPFWLTIFPDALQKAITKPEGPACCAPPPFPYFPAQPSGSPRAPPPSSGPFRPGALRGITWYGAFQGTAVSQIENKIGCSEDVNNGATATSSRLRLGGVVLLSQVLRFHSRTHVDTTLRCQFSQCIS